ncbi:effector protein SifA [Salmonella enterica subsp. enterica]|uniref:Effector protein SifA n=1 Tax=Salmonella enterica I TaxID=59201 RepID=A0A3S4I5A2_SALET|nr:effector protein SifA [Salmonella enterica subsp. enterica]
MRIYPKVLSKTHFLETMAMCGLKQLEIPPPHTHIPIEKMVKEVLLADKTFQAFLVTDPSTSQSMLAEIVEAISDQVFHAIFRIDPQAIQKMAEEQFNHATRSLRTTKRLFMLFFIKSDDAFSDVTFRVYSRTSCLPTE